MKYVWTSKKEWRRYRGGPWFGTWNTKIHAAYPIIAALVVGIPGSISSPLALGNPLAVLLYRTPGSVPLRSFLLFVFAGALGGTINALKTKRFLGDFIVVFDEAVYVQDRDRGGLMFRPGDVDVLVSISRGYLAFLLSKQRRGIKCLNVTLPVRVPEDVFETLLNALKPKHVIEVECGPSNWGIPSTKICLVLGILGEKGVDLAKRLAELNIYDYLAASCWRTRFKFCGTHIVYLCDWLMGLKRFREALTIALAPLFIGAKEYARAVYKALKKFLSSSWRRKLFNAPEKWDLSIIGPFYFFFGPAFLMAILFVLASWGYIKLSDMDVAYIAGYVSYLGAIGLYSLVSEGNYQFLIYLQAGKRFIPILILGALADSLIIGFFYFVLSDIVSPLFFAISLALYLFLALNESGLYVLYKTPEIAEAIVAEFYNVSPELESFVRDLLASIQPS